MRDLTRDRRWRPVQAGEANPQPRRGYSLIQFLVVVAVGTLLLGIAGRTIAIVLRTQTALQDHLRVVRLRSHAGRLFRDDVHAARTATVTPDGRTLQLQEPPVSWSLEGEQLIRREVREAGTSTEAFSLMGGTVRFRRPGEMSAAQVEMTLSAPEGKAGGTWAIRADLGLDRRFAGEGGP